MSDPTGRWAVLADDIAALPAALAASGAFDAEGMRYALRYLAAGIGTCLDAEDLNHPTLRHHIEPGRTWGLDNPDCRYRLCGLDPRGAYRLTGDPGTCTRLELQVNTGHLGDGQFADWQCLGRLDDRDLIRQSDGTVVIDIAATRPAGAANWLASGPDAAYLQVREYSSDWATERPSSFAVERLDTPSPPAAFHPDELTRRVALLRTWLTVGARCWAELGGSLADGEHGPTAPFLPPATATGLGGLAYGMGTFRIAPGRATIVEVTPPRCAYWSIALATRWWESPEPHVRQCSLNRAQAVVDPDGVVRLVIANEDPGVANWLDPGGHDRGTIAVRYLDAEELPVATQHDVAVAQLADELPEATLWCSPAERAVALQARRSAMARRYQR